MRISSKIGDGLTALWRAVFDVILLQFSVCLEGNHSVHTQDGSTPRPLTSRK